MHRRLRNARRRVYAWIAEGVTAVAVRIPYKWQRWFYGWTLRPMMHLLLAGKARRNLRRVFGDELTPKREKEILRGLFRGMAALPAEWMGFDRMGREFFDRYVDDTEGVASIHHTEQTYKKAWIGVTGHISNWELLAQWQNYAGLCPMGGIIAKRQPNPHLNRLIERMRGRFGMNTLYRDEPIAKIVRLLKRGHSIGIAGDQDVESLPGIFVEFLGSQAYTPVGPARLAWAADVPIVVGLMIRQGEGRYRVQMNAPIFPDRTRPKSEEILRMTQEWCRQLEAVIRENPEQWPWFHDRWKTTPERLEAKARKLVEREAAAQAATTHQRTG